MAVAALVLGIIGTLFSLNWLTVWVGGPPAIIALVLGILARKQLAQEGKPTGMATAGMVLGIVGTAIAVLIFAVCASCAAAVSSAGTQLANEAQKAAAADKAAADKAAADKAAAAPAADDDDKAAATPAPTHAAPAAPARK